MTPVRASVIHNAASCAWTSDDGGVQDDLQITIQLESSPTASPSVGAESGAKRLVERHAEGDLGRHLVHGNHHADGAELGERMA